jgi:hypothetical protein
MGITYFWLKNSLQSTGSQLASPRGEKEKSWFSWRNHEKDTPQVYPGCARRERKKLMFNPQGIYNSQASSPVQPNVEFWLKLNI